MVTLPMIAAAVALLAASCAAAQTITGHAKITDGDTFTMGPVVIRLHGIDAPEAGQRCSSHAGGTWDCGTDATNALAELVADRELSCQALDRDGYGRIIARCFANGQDIGAALVDAGLAWAFRRYSDDYVAKEAGAKTAGIGIWEADNQTPWDYRDDRWNRAAAASPLPGCPIKGNIASDGERIYHTPWSPAYSRTKITEGKGERWFCDEAEAVSAGWRAARWR
ncbi:thermonuclease family protein [Paracoccus saliphilus]|uniref:Endonuclease YncB, thermonuclease family n=1 Tax=Paracoccus saliphilus TaxID=405559 RepID=A0AA46A4D2_9RHOB|nr:thermonuclease family protein [Paracoccus saliphilus]WCR03748.1 thermonuclease family protein [Paracoccus saliphilus]SIS58947.1 Endonuclease YncB, thermonuclease family [Paracoccus saliphilus]